ncbi:inorganic phosphate transporter [Gimibacter soli]|uniref:Phosphate transporter n=1 Tax=Gimibacter soli TaxID=3024400 RepID=A0AAF0BKM0_9PROT|nr:inorganic phosphate transporter [Gimibacter soli]WCL54434.1 inorganic phosphate transporter [Gimibacter soli]
MELDKVDREVARVAKVQQAVAAEQGGLMKLGLALFFVVLVFLYATQVHIGSHISYFIIAAAVIGAYMAMNIGANDVANNVGPAVGSKALTMAGALVIAAVFEAAGALLAGGDVVSTISKDIISPTAFADGITFIWAMMAALLAAALWLNLATWLGAPVSTTHSIVGGVMGAGIAAAGFGMVNWPVMGGIAASWVISPILGGVIAAAFLRFVKLVIVEKEDKIAASKKWVPILVAIMAGTFTVYLVSKGLKHLWKPEAPIVWATGLAIAVASWAVMRPYVAHRALGLENRKKSVSLLFRVPLVCSAALLSFAHGANDVANAVGPLAAIVNAAESGASAAGKVSLPLWVMVIGAIGISIGLLLFGPKLIRTVGGEITKLNQMRAFCVALSAAITVIAASALGMPVSSTHIAVGGVFGVGFLREYLANKANGNARELSKITTPEKVAAKAEKKEKRRLVRRKQAMNIAAAWIITVPLSASLAAVLYLGARTFFG